MRKLIIGALVLVAVMGAWVLYLEYDTKRFIEGLPKAPQTEKHPVGTTEKKGIMPPLKVTASENTDVDLTEDTVSETSTPGTLEDTHTPTSDPFLENAVLEEGQGTEDTGLSPELEAFFTAYDPIDRALEEVSNVLEPLLDRDMEVTHRITEIGSEALPNAVDVRESRALYAELEELMAWQESVSEEIFELQDERERLYQERGVVFAKYGIADWREFERLYRETYTAWRSKP